MFDHVEDLLLHCDDEEEYEVEEEDGPEDRKVHYAEKRRKKTKDKCAHAPIPELELGKFSSERPEFIGARIGQRCI